MQLKYGSLWPDVTESGTSITNTSGRAGQKGSKAVARQTLKEHSFGDWKESPPECVNTLPSEHANSGSSLPDMDSCFKGASAPSALTSAMDRAGAVVPEDLGGKDWRGEYTHFGPVFPSLVVVWDRWSDVPIRTGPTWAAWSCHRAGPNTLSGQAQSHHSHVVF